MTQVTPVKFRNEMKYLLAFPDYFILRTRLQHIMKPDRYVNGKGYYAVRSLYFDDFLNSAYQEKQDGLLERRKYRIRIYNYSADVIHLECKIKNDRYVRKETAPLTRQEFNWLIKGYPQFLLDTTYDLHRRFYFEYMAKVLRPRVIVDYEREPFVMAAGDVRVTFDKNIRAGMDGLAMFDASMSTAEVLPPGQLVMEVKFTDFLPEIVRQILTAGVFQYLAISKYVLCCQQTIHKQLWN